MASRLKGLVIPLKGNGPIKAKLEAYGPMLALFSDSARNDIVRDAMWQGGEYYRLIFVPLKFSPYAKKLGYTVTPKYAAKKLKLGYGDDPLTYSGFLRAKALGGSRTEARATKTDAAAIIRLPGPGYMNQQKTVYRVMRTILADELERVAKQVGKAMAENLGGTASPLSTRGTPAQPRQLSSAQAATFSRSKTVAKPRRLSSVA